MVLRWNEATTEQLCDWGADMLGSLISGFGALTNRERRLLGEQFPALVYDRLAGFAQSGLLMLADVHASVRPIGQELPAPLMLQLSNTAYMLSDRQRYVADPDEAKTREAIAGAVDGLRQILLQTGQPEMIPDAVSDLVIAVATGTPAA